jgi:hypothetical protein
MATRVSRKDVGRLGKFQRTGDGGIVVPATVGRVGVLSYPEFSKADGSPLREYRAPDELFAADSLRSISDVVVTDDHPEADVTPVNYREVVVGHVRAGSARVERREDGEFVVADLVIGDAATIAEIERGTLAEISCGYWTEIDDRGGATPNGDRYDVVQRSIRYNHVSLQPPGGGRAGSTVRLQVDRKRNTAMKEIVNGVEYTIGTPEWAKAVREDAARQVTVANADRDRATARADSLDARVKTFEADAAPEKIEARVQARAELIAKATPVLGAEFFARKDAAAKPKTDGEIRAAVLAKVAPEIKLDGKSPAYIEALFDVQTSGEASLARARQDATVADPATQRDGLTADADPFADEKSDVSLLLREAWRS